jgi:hypothetical protein
MFPKENKRHGWPRALLVLALLLAASLQFMLQAASTTDTSSMDLHGPSSAYSSVSAFKLNNRDVVDCCDH